jgi:hypothetical protein
MWIGAASGPRGSKTVMPSAAGQDDRIDAGALMKSFCGNCRMVVVGAFDARYR